MPIRNASTIIPRGAIRLSQQAQSRQALAGFACCTIEGGFRERRIAPSFGLFLAQEIQDRVGMLCIKVRKHSLKRAVVAGVALAQEADTAYPRRDGHRASAILSVTKYSHRSVVVQPSTIGRPGSAWLYRIASCRVVAAQARPSREASYLEGRLDKQPSRPSRYKTSGGLVVIHRRVRGLGFPSEHFLQPVVLAC